MNKSRLNQGLLSTCVLTSLLFTAARAQDNYWLLDGNKYVNTATQSAVYNAGLVGPASNPHVRTVYDASGNEVFSYGANDVTWYTSNLGIGGGVQAFPIPGACKQYYVLNVFPEHGPHVTDMTLTKIDASGGGMPVTSTPVTLVGSMAAYSGHPFWYGAVAAPMNPDGSRYVYHMSGDINNSVCYLYRFTVAANGTINYTPTLISSSLPLGGGRMKMSPDGQSLAYTNTSGQLVTYNISTNTATSYGKTALGKAQVMVGGVRRWYVSTGTDLGYFIEGNTTFMPVNSTNGINSDIAQGKDGYVYVANGNPAAGTGSLVYFWPASATPSFSPVTGAQVLGVNGASPTAYSFGSQVEGEDINLSQTPASVSFTLNNVTPPPTAPGIIWVCGGTTTVPLNATIGGQHTQYYFSYQYGTYSGGVFTPTTGLTSVGPIAGFGPTYTTPFWVGSGATFMRVTFTVYGACGNNISKTQLYEIKPVSVLANYTKPGCISSGIPCSKPIQTTLPITTAAPTPSSSIPTFRGNVDAATGYMGAGNCGMYGINTNGNWTVSVYEVDDATGVRKIRSGITAPTIAYFTGSGSASGVTYFNQNSYAFDGSNPPFYNDVTTNYGDGPYFSDFYSWSRTNGSLATDFGTRVYCAEMVVTEPTSGCSVTNKSYFKIAVNGSFSNGSNAKPGRGDEEGQTQGSVYPNPVTTTLGIAIPAGTAHASVRLMDHTGRVILENEPLRNGRNTLDVQHLPAGIYFYQLSVDGQEQHGKVVKQ